MTDRALASKVARGSLILASRPWCRRVSAFARFPFPPEVISRAVRWYLRFGPSYRDLEELFAGRGIEVDQVALCQRSQRFTPALVDAVHPCPGARWVTVGSSTRRT